MSQRFVPLSALAALVAWSTLAALAELGAVARAAEPVVYLGESTGNAVYGNGVLRPGMLIREIARQTLWVKAREDCGLTVRDAWLEDAPTDSEAATLAQGRVLDIAISPGPENLVELIDGYAPQGIVFETDKFAMPPKVWFDYLRYLKEINDLAERRWVASLAKQYGGKAGIAGPADDARKAKAIAAAAALEPRLAKLTFVDQFVALRGAHLAMAEHGEAAQLLGALVRGYANLGFLTDTHFSPSHKVFHARALVYAERLVRHESASPWSLAHRAYAAALAGLEKGAITDLAAVDRAMPSADAALRPVPAWTAVIDDYCHYRIAALTAVARSEPEFQLGRALGYIAVTHTGDTPRIVEAALETVAALPELYLVVDDYYWVLDRSFSFENKEVDWEEPYRELRDGRGDSLGSHLYAGIAAVEGLPPSVAEVLAPANLNGLAPRTQAEYALRGRLIASLESVPDDGSPLPWSVLGRIVREASFLQAFQQDGYNGYGGTLEKEMAPLVATHPYRPFFDAAENNSNSKRNEPLAKLAAAIRFGAIERSAGRLVGILSSNDLLLNTAATATALRRAGDAMRTNDDQVTRDGYYQIAHRFANSGNARSMLEINPNLPRAVHVVLRNEPDKYLDRIEGWRGLAADHPEIAALLEKQTALQGTPEEQEKALTATFAKNPDPEVAKRLMTLQWERKDLDAWEATMRTFIERSARTGAAVDACVGAARSLIRLRKFERARPFAEAAVEYEAAEGRQAAAMIEEAAQNWEAAEKSYRAYSQTRWERACDWYFFCRRTGQGDQAEARKHAEKNLPRSTVGGILLREGFMFNGGLDDGDQPTSALFSLLDKDPAGALPMLRELYIRSNDPLWGLYAAPAADRLENRDEFQKLLKQVAERGLEYRIGSRKTGRQRTSLVGLAKLMQADYAGGGQGLDRAAIDKLRAAAHGRDIVEFDALTGLYCEQRGNETTAIEAWLRAMSSPEIAVFGRTLAGARLWERNITPARYRDALAGRTTEDK